MSGWTTNVSGFGFLEGPVSLGQGTVAFVDLLDQRIRVLDGSGVREIAVVDGSPNGMRLGPDARLWFTNNGGLSPNSDKQIVVPGETVSGRIQSVDVATGEVRDEVTDLAGGGTSRPNDLVFGPDGRLLFTDPGNWEVLPDEDAYQGGRLYAATPGDDAALLLAEGLAGFTNGIGFHPDGSLLVGLTTHLAIVKYHWTDGMTTLGCPEPWADLSSVGAMPDGFVIAGDRLYVAGSTGDVVAVTDLEGRVVDSFPTGTDSDPTNLLVADGRLWVTLGYQGSLISREL